LTLDSSDQIVYEFPRKTEMFFARTLPVNDPLARAVGWNFYLRSGVCDDKDLAIKGGEQHGSEASETERESALSHPHGSVGGSQVVAEVYASGMEVLCRDGRCRRDSADGE
jgi:hypothetical protein